jgi:hypothetical protein
VDVKEQSRITIFDAKDMESLSNPFATVVCKKGGTDAYVVEVLDRMIDQFGMTDAYFHSDGDGAIKDLVKVVARRCEKLRVNTSKQGTQRRFERVGCSRWPGVRRDNRSACRPGVRRAYVCGSRWPGVRRDPVSSPRFARWPGVRRANVFTKSPNHEKVHNHPMPRFLRGIFLGKSDTSDSYIVACSDGRVRVTRVIRRKPAGSEFCAKDVQELRALPWALNAEGVQPALEDVRALPAMPAFRPGDDDIGRIHVPEAEAQREPADERVIDLDAPVEEEIIFPDDMNDVAGSSTPLAHSVVRQADSPTSPPASSRPRVGLESSPKREGADPLSPISPVRQRTDHIDTILSDIDVRINEIGMMCGIEDLCSQLDAGVITDELRSAGRVKELQQMKDFGVYEAVDRNTVKGVKVIKTRWVENLKSSSEARCRFVAKDIAYYRRGDVYAATPSNLAKRLIECFAAKLHYPTMVADVSVAFLHAPAGARTIYVEPPDEFFWEVDRPIGSMVWKLHKQLYGCRDAPRAWQEHLVTKMLELDFIR